MWILILIAGIILFLVNIKLINLVGGRDCRLARSASVRSCCQHLREQLHQAAWCRRAHQLMQPAPQVRHFTRGARVRALTPAAFWFAKPHLILYMIKFTMFLLAFNVSNSIFFSFHFTGASCYYAR